MKKKNFSLANNPIHLNPFRKRESCKTLYPINIPWTINNFNHNKLNLKINKVS